MIGNIRKDIHRTPKERAWILLGLIPRPPKGAKNTDMVWHSAVGTVLSPLWNPGITGSNRIVLMESSDNVILFGQPGLGIIRNTS